MSTKARVIAVTSGKGGVGKTNASVNLAVALASLSRRVCVFDADTNQANANILLGLAPKLTLEHVLDGQHPIDDILLEAPGGIFVVPAASGIADGDDLDDARRQRLASALASLEARFDYLIVDTAAGSSRDVIFFLRAATLILMVITTEPTSLTNSFSLLRVMLRAGVQAPTQVVVNQVANKRESNTIFNRFQAAVAKYLRFEITALGYILSDDTVKAAVHTQRPVIYLRHDAPASLCFYELAKRLDHTAANQPPAVTTQGLSDAVAATGKPVAPASAAEEEIQAGLTHPTPERVADLLRFALRALRETANVDQSQAATAIDGLVDTFVQRFNALPFTLSRTLYQYLETNDYPPETIRSLVFTLETLYVQREGRTLRDSESLVAILMAEAHGDKSRVTELSRHLADSFMRQFGQAIPLAPEHVLSAIAAGQFDRPTLQRLRDAVDTALAPAEGNWLGLIRSPKKEG